MTTLGPRPHWWDDAVCAGMAGAGVSPMFPTFVGDQVTVAAEVCSTCPVTGPCLAYALRHNIEEGVWGGRTEVERRRLRRQRQRSG